MKHVTSSQVKMLGTFAGAVVLGYLAAAARGFSAELCLASGLLFSLSINCVVTDLRYYRLYNWNLLAIALLGFATQIYSNGFVAHAALEACARSALYGAQFQIVRSAYRAWKGKHGLGLGDVKLAAAAGGWLAPSDFGLAVLSAAVTAILLAFWLTRQRKRTLKPTTYIPFGAPFAMSIWLFWLVAP
jgi:leader peptidase (prepilin peptidase)/N-methyltransferase